MLLWSLAAAVLVVFLVLHAQASRRMLVRPAASSGRSLLQDAETVRTALVGTEVLALACGAALVAGSGGAPPVARAVVALVVVAVLVVRWPAHGVAVKTMPAALRLLGKIPIARRREAPEPPPSDPLDEAGLVARMLRLRGTSAAEFMIPRSDMVALRSGAKIAELLALVEEHRHSRYPVYEDNVDRVIGYVSVFDLLKLPVDESSFASLVRPIVLVPEGKPAVELLDELTKRREECALVVDEFGGTAGLITAEDLIEELVGDILDEHEQEETEVRRVGRDSYVCDATISLTSLRDAIGLVLPEGDYETLAGFLLEEFGRIPAKGDSVTRENATFDVVRASRQRIELVQIRLRRSTGRR